MIGKEILHYRVLEELGRGGMGVVYKARDTKLDRFVALKFLPVHLSASEQDKVRFIQEAKAASAMNHPNICTVYSIDEYGGQLFIAMEYVEGQSLHELIGSQHDSPMPVKRAIEIGTQLAEGLGAAHDKGIVHRDIKPENIMVRKDGIVQIMDFGLAKLHGVSRLTKEGSTVGTAGYMSPEQVQGQEADHRSDVFSLGVVLYELFAGQPPFRGVHETALTYEIVNVDPVPVSALRPEIDRNLDVIILGCLEKDPNERTQSAKQVAIDLKRVRRESSRTHPSRVAPVREAPGVPAGPPRLRPMMPSWARFLWPSVSAILAIALLVTAWTLWKSRDVHRAIGRFGIFLPKDQALDIVNNQALAVSPDGSRVVYRANGRLYQRRTGSFECDVMPGTEEGFSPFFSMDSRWIGFFAGGQLKKIPVAGGSAVVLADAPNPRGGTWLKDGVIVFAPNPRNGLSLVREDGTEVRQITTVDTLNGERTHRWPQRLPDGRTITFTIGTMDSPDYYEEASIGSVDVQTGVRKVILKGASTARYIPTGHLVYSHAGTLFAVPFDVSHLETKGAGIPMVSEVSSDVTTGASQYSCSDNGVLAYVPGQSNLENRSLALMDQSGEVRLFPAAAQPYVDPQLSPDGKRVALAIQSGKNFDIWVYDIQRNTSTRLTFGGANRSPVWSPDGRRLAFSANSRGPDPLPKKSRVLIIDADGSGVPKEFVLNFDRNYVNCWSRDGSTLVVTVPQEGMGWDLMAIPVNDDRSPWTVLSTKFDESFATLSPDRKWMAYISTETGTAQVYVRSFPNGEGKWEISTDIATRPEWSADGKTLYYSSQQAIMAVPIQAGASLMAGQPRILVRNYHRLSVESAVDFNVSPDGKHVLVTIAKEGADVHQQINVVLNWFDEIENGVTSAR